MQTSNLLRSCLALLTLLSSGCVFIPPLQGEHGPEYDYTGWGYAGLGELTGVDAPAGSDIDMQEIVGAFLEAREVDTSWSSTLGVQYARDAEVGDLEFFELVLGARHYPDPWGALAPYFSGGFVAGQLRVDQGPSGTFKEEDFGAFLGTGLKFALGSGAAISLDYRFLFMEYGDSTGDFEADAHQVTVGLGISL